MSTKISWTSDSWNPVTGCSRISPGCAKCYAEALSLRFGWSKKPWTAQNAAENVVLHPDRLDQPLRWKKPRRIFVNSMSDLFHDLVPFDFIDQVFQIMGQASWHTFQILTKRPQRMLGYFEDCPRRFPGFSLAQAVPLPNVQLGVSVEDERRANERIPLLQQTPASVRFLSCEPLLGPINLRHGEWIPPRGGGPCVNLSRPWEVPHPTIDWVIVGGESGPDFRPMDHAWARAIRDQCVAADVAFFFKQDSAFKTESRPYLDGMVWHQYPGELTPPVPWAEEAVPS